jgi:uncharacterized protein YndB with AHSA1/START domain
VSTQAAPIPAVRRSVVVKRSVEDAFRIFTDGIASWWPLDTHSIARDREGVVAETVVLEGREGGRLFERMSDGTDGYWGTITAWDPPRRLVVSWHVNPDAPAPTEIEVRFAPEDDGTRVDLEHRGWERLGAEGPSTRDNYQRGWEGPLASFAAFADGSS